MQQTECPKCSRTYTAYGLMDTECPRCHEESHTCPECGSWIYDGEPCDYCYEVVTRYTVKLGNTVLYRGYDSDTADAAYSAALDRQQWRVRLTTQENVVINRRAHDHTAA